MWVGGGVQSHGREHPCPGNERGRHRHGERGGPESGLLVGSGRTSAYFVGCRAWSRAATWHAFVLRDREFGL